MGLYINQSVYYGNRDIEVGIHGVSLPNTLDIIVASDYLNGNPSSCSALLRHLAKTFTIGLENLSLCECFSIELKAWTGL